ncbi:retrovirus-related pol polyprotein from transposon TNT 1-94 [Tanacetum coccineum]|uniref:Retrovirus-related pol polyprotein from transposon TNT 1-94 n=1 Tax=Tanacetum coccineum TaxID=301880 RepID=A0ABQ5B5D8_9ASTR
MNMTLENRAHFESEKEAIHLILIRIGDEIYSTVDACQTAQEMWEAIERLQQALKKDSVPEQSEDKDMKEFGLLCKILQENSTNLPTNNLRILNKTPGTRLWIMTQAEKLFNFQAEQLTGSATRDEEIDEQEWKAHYSYMAKISRGSYADSGNDAEPLEQWKRFKVVESSEAEIDELESDKADIFQHVVVSEDNRTWKMVDSTTMPFSITWVLDKRNGTVRFGNDQFAPILGYGDLVQGNISIERVYYVSKRSNHNTFSRVFGHFCDSVLEVAFRKSTCLVRMSSGMSGIQLVPSCEVGKAKRYSSFKSKKFLVQKEDRLMTFFKEEGIEHQTSTPRTPEQNDVVERRNRTLVASFPTKNGVDYDNHDPRTQQLQNVLPSADTTVPYKEWILFGPLSIYFHMMVLPRVNKSSLPTINSAHMTTNPFNEHSPILQKLTTPTNVHAEEKQR